VSKYNNQVIDGGLTNADYKTGTFVEQAATLISGKVAMVAQVDALVPLLTAKLSTEQLNAQIGWFPVSATGPTAQFAADATNAVSVFKTGNTRNETASKAFISFWLGEDYPAYIAANKVPSIEPAVPSPAGLPDIVTAASKAFPTATQMYYGCVFFAPDIHIYLNQMLFGQKTPDSLAAAMESQFKQQGKAQGIEGF
jgi:raffinose/stachyose/melibiose transport system substrate-binding protein